MASMVFSRALFLSGLANAGALSEVSISCETTGAELALESGLALANCPANCQESQVAVAYGASVHPTTSSICAAALVDGALPQFGGKVVVSAAPSVAAYVAVDGGVVASQASSGDGSGSFTVYAADSIDQIAASARLVDEQGQLAAAGLLQVRGRQGFGAVCGINSGAANVVCRMLGYNGGAVGSSPCGAYGGANMCGAVGSRVAMKNLKCRGDEMDLASCAWEAPDEICAQHDADSVVHCASDAEVLTEGDLRLISFDGAPSADGVGRLEVFSEGAWGPVCADGFGAGAAAVSCKQMGFSGAQEGGFAACAARGDRDYCNEHAPVWSSVACSGSEMVLSDCAAEKNADVYCAPSESIVIACAGDGQTEGGAPAGEAPRVEKSLFAPKRRLSCDSTLESEMLTDASPGSTYVASCPAGCSANIVFGSIAYSAASSICGASVHGGAAGNAGGDVVVVVGHGQDSYFGSTSNGVSSQDAGGERRSFTVARVSTEVAARVAAAPVAVSAGASALGL